NGIAVKTLLQRVFLPQGHLTDLADAGLVDALHKAHLEQHHLLVHHSLLRVTLHMSRYILGSRLALRARHYKGKGPLAPPLIRCSDDSDFGNRRVMRDDVLQFQRGDPLPCNLYDILGPVRDLQIAEFVTTSNVSRMEIASLPEPLRRFCVLEISLRKPGRADNYLADTPGITRLFNTRRVNNLEIHQGQGSPGLAADHRLLFRRKLQHLGGQMGQGEDRAGFRHPVSGKHINPSAHCLQAKGTRHGSPADEEFPARKIDPLGMRVLEQHVKYRRHTVREGHLLFLKQLKEGVRDVTTRINLLYAEHCRHIGDPPGVDMEHRSDRHVDILPVKTPVPHGRSEHSQNTQRMEYQLSLAEIDPLWHPGSPGRIEGRGADVLVKILEIECGRRLRYELFVLAGKADCRYRRGRFVIEQHKAPYRVHSSPDLLQNRQEFAVYQKKVVLGMIYRVKYLFRGKTDINRVKNRPYHRHCKEAFQITVGVPVHNGNRIARLDTQTGQQIGKSPDPLFQLPVSVTKRIAIDYLLVRSIDHG